MAFLVGVAAGIALAPAVFEDPARETAADPRPATAPEVPRDAAPARPAAKRAAAAPETPAASAPEVRREVAPDVREVSLGSTATTLSAVLVEVRDAKGDPRDDLEVFALPAAARGTDEEDEVFLVETDDEGRARLDLPGPRSYDVGVRARGGVLRRLDLAVPAPGPVTFVEPALATVRVVAEGLDSAVSVRFESAVPDASFNYPGRSDAGYWKNDVDVRAGEEAAVEVPVGQDFLVTAPAGWVAVPDVVRAPGEVRLQRGRGHVLNVEFEFVPPDRTWRHWKRFQWTVAVDGAEGAAGKSSERLTFWLESGKPLSRIDRTAAIVAPSARGAVTWRGSGIDEGRLPFDAQESATLRATVVVPEAPPDPATHGTIRVEADPEDLNDEGTALVFVGYDPDGDVTDTRVPAGNDHVLDVEGAWVLVRGNEREPEHGAMAVAGPHPIVPGTPLVLRPRPGGYVVFAPVRLRAAGGAPLTLARADGAPLFRREHDGDIEVRDRFEAVPGTVLGPFEPGEVVLDLRAGPLTWRRFAVDVRAGEVSVLRVPAAE